MGLHCFPYSQTDQVAGKIRKDSRTAHGQSPLFRAPNILENELWVDVSIEIPMMLKMESPKIEHARTIRPKAEELRRYIVHALASGGRKMRAIVTEHADRVLTAAEHERDDRPNEEIMRPES
jgi:hypothetical protein